MSRAFRVAVLLSTATLGTSCGVTTPPVSTASPVPLTSPADYAEWPSLTPKPVRIAQELFAMCAPAQRTDNGPHFVPVVKLYANPVALQTFQRNGKAPLPVGAIVVKEKWWNETAAQPNAFAAMRKREPGYDAEHGDWEYVYVGLGAERQEERGKIESCRECHKAAATTDYLFRTHWNLEALAGGSQ